MKFGFVGPTYASRSPNLSAEHSINLFPARIESGKGTNEFGLFGTPGLELFASLTDSPTRAMFAENGRLFVVAGGSFFQIFSDGSATRIGTVDTDTNPASIASNGQAGQLLVASGGTGYIYTIATGAFVEITDVDAPDNFTMVGFLDGYFIALDSPNSLFRLSNLNDGLLWDGFDAATRTFASDPLLSMIVDHRELWLLGEQTTEVWYNSGAPEFPLQPIVGTFIEDGIIAPWTVQRLDNSIMWLNGDERGHGIAYRAQGYTPARISNHSSEHGWNQFTQISDAIAYTYQQEGHAFYVLHFPSPLKEPRLTQVHDVHWVFDVSTGMWHERALWDPLIMDWVPHLSRAHAFAFGKNLIGDRQSGAIYNMSLTLYDENVVYTSPAAP